VSKESLWLDQFGGQEYDEHSTMLTSQKTELFGSGSD
jgi:hypothetical protein